MPPKIWIVLVDYNGLEDTRKCLASLNEMNGCSEVGVVVVDNASRVDVRAELVSEFPQVHFLKAAANGGWAGGNNLGMTYSFERGAELVILLNNDTIVSPDFVARLKSAADTRPDFGIIGPVIRFMEPPHEVQTDGVLFNRRGRPGFFQRREVPLRREDPPAVDLVDIVNGCCMMIRVEVYRAIGIIDEAFFLIHEEADYCLRAARAGLRCGVLAEALVFHKGSSTFKREGKRLQRYYDARNLVRLMRKRSGPRGARDPLLSGILVLRYCRHRWTHEIESGHNDSARAVLEGVYDAMIGRYGAYASIDRPGLTLIERMLRVMSTRLGARRLRML